MTLAALAPTTCPPGDPAPVRITPTTKGDTFDSRRVKWVMSLDDLPELWAALATAAECVIDLETTGLDSNATVNSPGNVAARISMAALTLPQKGATGMDLPVHAWVLPLSHPDGPLRGVWRQVATTLCHKLRAANVPLVNQNLGFDLRWLYSATGVDLTAQYQWDTQLSSHLIDETASTKLKERVPAVFGIERWDDHDLSTPAASERVPLFELGEYAARDTYWTWRLAVLHRVQTAAGDWADGNPPADPEEAEDYQLGQVAQWCAMPMGASLAAISQRGFKVDREWVENTILDEAATELDAFNQLVDRYPLPLDVGSPSFAPTSKWFMAWAEAAVFADDLRVTSMTGTGRPQWSKSVLTRQARAWEDGAGAASDINVAGLLLQLRGAAKRQEYLRSWLEVMTPDDTIHATYHAGRVVTGRLSSSDPNMQQVTYALRPAFVPRDGYLIADIDYSQIELRVAAFISRCEPMLAAYRRGDDLHTLMAAQITGKAVADVTKPDRQAAKAANFGYLYGMGSGSFTEYAETAYGVSFTPEESEGVRRAFFDQWAGMEAWHAAQVREVAKTGRVVSPIGRVRRLPEIHSGNDQQRSHAERNAINAPVQGFASDLMQIAAARIGGLYPGHAGVPDVRVVATVHDSVVVEVPADDWQRATARCMRTMMDLDEPLARLGCTLDVPLAAEANVGTRWGLADVGVIA